MKNHLKVRSISAAMGLALSIPAIAWDPSDSKKPAEFMGSLAYCYLKDNPKTWTLGNEAVERVIQFDSERGGLRSLMVRSKAKNSLIVNPAESMEGEIHLRKAGDVPFTLRLDKGWHFSWQIVTTPAHGGRKLTIHLQGKGANEGWEAEAYYEIMPGNRPWVRKSLLAINRTGQEFQADLTVLDRFTSPAPVQKPGVKGMTIRPPQLTLSAPGDSISIIDPNTMMGMAAAVESGGDCQIDRGAALIRAKLSGSIPGDGGRMETPSAWVAPFLGNHGTGVSLVKRWPG